LFASSTEQRTAHLSAANIHLRSALSVIPVTACFVAEVKLVCGLGSTHGSWWDYSSSGWHRKCVGPGQPGHCRRPSPSEGIPEETRKRMRSRTDRGI